MADFRVNNDVFIDFYFHMNLKGDEVYLKIVMMIFCIIGLVIKLTLVTVIPKRTVSFLRDVLKFLS
jgi:hypothetical protein